MNKKQGMSIFVLMLFMCGVITVFGFSTYLRSDGDSIFDTNFGIHTESPSQALDVNGSVNVSNNVYVGGVLFPLNNINISDDSHIGIGNNERIVFDENGDIAVMGATFSIGTLTGDQMLEVSNKANGVVLDARIQLDADDDTAIQYLVNGSIKMHMGWNRGNGRFNFNNESSVNVFRMYPNGDFWAQGDISGDSITDRTKRSDDDIKVLKLKVKNIDSSKDKCKEGFCEIDKSQYPQSWVREEQVCRYQDEDGGCLLSETIKVRDLTVTVSDLIRLVSDQEKRIQELENAKGK